MVAGVTEALSSGQMSAARWSELLHHGQIVVARVEAMVGRDLARLLIKNQPIEVSTPVLLNVGAVLKLAIEKRDGAIRLLLKADSEGINAGITRNQVLSTGEANRNGLLIGLEQIHTPEGLQSGTATSIAQIAAAYAADDAAGRLSEERQVITSNVLPLATKSETSNGLVSHLLVPLFQYVSGKTLVDATLDANKENDPPKRGTCECRSKKPAYIAMDPSGNGTIVVCEWCDPRQQLRSEGDQA